MGRFFYCVQVPSEVRASEERDRVGESRAGSAGRGIRYWIIFPSMDPEAPLGAMKLSCIWPRALYSEGGENYRIVLLLERTLSRCYRRVQSSILSKAWSTNMAGVPEKRFLTLCGKISSKNTSVHAKESRLDCALFGGRCGLSVVA